MQTTRTSAALTVDQLNHYSTTARNCGCDDYLDGPDGFVCHHMQMVREHGDRLEQATYYVRVGSKQFPKKEWKLRDEAPKSATAPNTKAAPATTDGACLHYGATDKTCNCPDATTRNGGSYLLSDGRRGCKHRARRLQQALDRAFCAQGHVELNRETVANRANRAIDSLFGAAPARSAGYQASRMVDDGLSSFFGYEMKVSA